VDGRFGHDNCADSFGHARVAAWLARVDPVRQAGHLRCDVGGGPGWGLVEGGCFGLDDGAAAEVRLGDVGEQAVDWGCNGVFDDGAELAFFAVAVAIPGGAPDAVEVPAEAAEDFLAEPVAVAGDFGGVVLVAIAFDAEGVDAGVVGVADADVDAVSGGADLRGELVSPGVDDADDRLLKWGFGVTSGTRVESRGPSVSGENLDFAHSRSADVVLIHRKNQLDESPTAPGRRPAPSPRVSHGNCRWMASGPSGPQPPQDRHRPFLSGVAPRPPYRCQRCYAANVV
jgi:hypothetical protein